MATVSSQRPLYNEISEPSKRVRVTFFESLRPLVVTSPSPEPADLLDSLHAASPLATMAAPADHVTVYTRQESTDSGWDNPFRPDGDLSREADEIVELIKGGKPITPTPGSTAPPIPESHPDSVDAADPQQLQQQQQQLQQQSQQLQESAPKQANSKPASGGGAGANGNAPGALAKPPANATAAPDGKAAAPGAVEVQRGTVVQPSDASQVEHVVIKKKPKCKCCVIQ